MPTRGGFVGSLSEIAGGGGGGRDWQMIFTYQSTVNVPKMMNAWDNPNNYLNVSPATMHCTTITYSNRQNQSYTSFDIIVNSVLVRTQEFNEARTAYENFLFTTPAFSLVPGDQVQIIMTSLGINPQQPIVGLYYKIDEFPITKKQQPFLI